MKKANSLNKQVTKLLKSKSTGKVIQIKRKQKLSQEEIERLLSVTRVISVKEKPKVTLCSLISKLWENMNA